MVGFVTLQQAKDHLRLDFDDADDDLELKIDQAFDIITDYLKIDADTRSDWEADPSLIPARTKAAMLLLLTDLWDVRDGTGDGDYIKADGPIARLLMRQRDPAMA